jgi:hypothetical protein
MFPSLERHNNLQEKSSNRELMFANSPMSTATAFEMIRKIRNPYNSKLKESVMKTNVVKQWEVTK